MGAAFLDPKAFNPEDKLSLKISSISFARSLKLVTYLAEIGLHAVLKEGPPVVVEVCCKGSQVNYVNFAVYLAEEQPGA